MTTLEEQRSAASAALPDPRRALSPRSATSQLDIPAVECEPAAQLALDPDSRVAPSPVSLRTDAPMAAALCAAVRTPEVRSTDEASGAALGAGMWQ